MKQQIKQSLRDLAEAILTSDKYNICDRVRLPAREPVLEGIPSFYYRNRIGSWIRDRVAAATGKAYKGIYMHQAAALEEWGRGENVAVTTSTGSGKSLIFQAATLDTITHSPTDTVLSLFSSKALLLDQVENMKHAMESAGFNPDEQFARIDGNVLPSLRGEHMKKARVAYLTPDVGNAWLLQPSSLQDPVISNYIANLHQINIDEAHLYDRVFGSHAFYFLRRLQIVRDILREQKGLQPAPVRFMATSATLKNAKSFLKKLTGQTFSEIDPSLDGSGKHEQNVVHVASLHNRHRSDIRKLVTRFLREPTEGNGIAFIDSRTGTEAVARSINHWLQDHDSPYVVEPLRSGYNSGDFRNAFFRIRTGAGKFAVSTSILQQGIDIGALSVMVHEGVPVSRSDAQQRAGRVGRKSPGLSIIVAPEDAFERRGTTLKAYFTGAVENPLLYTGNKAIAAIEAKLMFSEFQALGVPEKDMRGHLRRYGMPPEFMQAFDLLLHDAASSPVRVKHYEHSMRGGFGRSGTLTIMLLDDAGREVGEMGRIDIEQALRECYPDAVYLHRGQTFRVASWKNIGGNRKVVQVERYHGHASTQPITNIYANILPLRESLIDERYKSSPRTGFFVMECQLEHVTRVSGYYEIARHNTEPVFYNKVVDPTLHNVSHRYQTQGVVMALPGSLFEDKEKRQKIAAAIRRAYCETNSIAPDEIGIATLYVNFTTNAGHIRVENAIALFDRVEGGLRLLENLYDTLPDIIRKADIDLPDAAQIKEQMLDYLSKSVARTSEQAAARADKLAETTKPSYSPGTLVWRKVAGTVVKKNDSPPKPANCNDKAGDEKPDVYALFSVVKKVILPDGADGYEIVPYNPNSGKVQAAKGVSIKAAASQLHYIKPTG